MPSSDAEAAAALKQQGNKAFAQHDWPTAISFYTQAIEKYDKEPSFFCNRAQVRLYSRCAVRRFHRQAEATLFLRTRIALTDCVIRRISNLNRTAML
jgi:hypothetical protein